MRQETQKIMSAFLRGQKASAARTNTDGHNVWLHGNKIAQRSEGDFLDFSSCRLAHSYNAGSCQRSVGTQRL